MSASSDRYNRHGDSFPNARRLDTVVIEIGGQDAPETSGLLIAGLASAGVGAIVSTFTGRSHPGGHWLQGSHDQLVAHVNPDVAFEHLPLESALLYGRLHQTLDRYHSPWVVVHANYPRYALEELSPLAAMDVEIPVVLEWNGPSGVYAVRRPNPQAACEFLAHLGARGVVLPSGHAELPMLAAGIVANEILMGGAVAEDDLRSSRMIAFYSLARRHRIRTTPEESPAALIDEIAEASWEPAGSEFTDKRVRLIGCGALGNWTAVAIAQDGNVHMTLCDGDGVETHNLSRQVLLVGHVGDPKATALAGELDKFALGHFVGEPGYIRTPADLTPLEDDVLICVPDHNHVRALAAAAAWQRRIPYAQAGTSAIGGQSCVQQPGRACVPCMTGLSLENVAPQSDPDDSSASCAHAEDSVVSSNMVTAALMVSELRRALAGHRAANLAFHGRGAGQNRIGWQISNPPCPHRQQNPCGIS